MAYKKFRQPIVKTIICSCGSIAKLSSRKNYPFGKNSAPVKSIFYKCSNCKKETFKDNSKGGKR